MKLTRWSRGCLGCILFACALAARHAAVQAAQARLPREALEAWKRAESEYAQVVGRFTVTRQFDGIDRPSTTESCEFAVNGRLIKGLQQSNGREELTASNPHYWFRLGRPAAGGQFGITARVMAGEKPSADPSDRSASTPQAEFDRELRDDIFASWTILTRTLGEFFTQPGIVILSVQESPPDGGRIAGVKVEFSYQPPAGEDPKLAIPAGFAIFDRSNNWALLEASIEKFWGTIHSTYKYDRSDSQTPPRLREEIETWKSESGTMIRTLTFDEWRNELVPESEFTFSAYGIPEPTDSGGSTRRRWMIGVNAAVLLALISYWLRRRRFTESISRMAAAR